MGRLINADKFKQEVATMIMVNNYPISKGTGMLKIIDMQPPAINGIIVDAEYAYQRKTYIHPTEHHYEELGEKEYIKYSCPVCDAIGNHHQVTKENENCPLCNVNLCWGDLSSIGFKFE